MTNQEMMSSWLSINETTNVNECQSASIVCSFSLVSLSRCSTNISTEYNHCNRLQWLYTKQWQVGVELQVPHIHFCVAKVSFFPFTHWQKKYSSTGCQSSPVDNVLFDFSGSLCFVQGKKKSKRQSTVEEVNGLGEWYSLIPGVCISM